MNEVNIHDLQSLCGEGIAATYGTLAAYMSTNLVRVSPRFSRCRAWVQVPGKQLGLEVDGLGETGKEFYANQLSAGRLCLIPRDDERKLSFLEDRVRRCVDNAKIGEDLVPFEKYRAEIRPVFEETRTTLFGMRDEIVSRWDSLVRKFREGAEDLLSGVSMPDEERIKALEQIMIQLPSREYYRDSFRVRMNLVAFPATAAPEGLESSIAAELEGCWKEELVATALKAIEATLGKAFALLGSAARAFMERESIHGSTMHAIHRLAEDLKWKNVFQNSMLSRLQSTLAELPSIQDADSREIFVEAALADIWSYGRASHLKLNPSVTPFTAGTLDAMAANLT